MSIALLTILLETEAKPSSPDLTRYVLVCVGMLGLVLALAYGFRRLLSGNLKRRAATRSLQVVDMLPMGGKQRLVVVRCYDRHFLIGMGDKELTSIAELEASSDELPPSSVLDMPSLQKPVHQRGFAGALDSVLAMWKRPSNEQTDSSQPAASGQQAAKAPEKVAPVRVRKRRAQPSKPKPGARKQAQGASKWNQEEGILG